MAEASSAISRRTGSSDQETELTIPPHLKFLISNIKNLVPTQLTTENYAIWRLQLYQHFSANRYDQHLTGASICPPETETDEYNRWKLVDRNLISAILSTISAPILPYVLTLHTAQEIWTTLERRLQPTNRSRVIQLKSELHQIQMKDKTMLQYLDQIKKIVDSIAAAGSNVDTEDIVLYILNGLPAQYNPFKTAIRTSLQPISLDDLYSLLCSEEINLQHQQNQESQISDHTALLSNRNAGYRSRTSKPKFKSGFFRGQGSTENQHPSRTPTTGLFAKSVEKQVTRHSIVGIGAILPMLLRRTCELSRLSKTLIPPMSGYWTLEPRHT
ncbi:hypothetical protein KFK09_022547 [Dendrobium nobile]|uniref:Retrovirus-related Pol polyprotein from transposon TNT 1-94 n=1 Tax=Dendrobium nobile TaxID=94219 RepID=A0A8T3AI52_DENNO|nr:hypothetical protein KFK09_022547 [Dendrobium nobile]